MIGHIIYVGNLGSVEWEKLLSGFSDGLRVGGGDGGGDDLQI